MLKLSHPGGLFNFLIFNINPYHPVNNLQNNLQFADTIQYFATMSSVNNLINPMLLQKVETWLNGNEHHAGVSSVLNEKWHNIRQAKSPFELKKAMFTLAFYMGLTKATNPANLTQLEWGSVVLWHLQTYQEFDPNTITNRHGIKPNW